ncbi:MAG: T9SS type A sorting domain-containing protein [Ignavibacteriaceae bacterium]|nr:T9SS type A sorting domain-containing protein [Ignavibacteriaceae bacterium]
MRLPLDFSINDADATGEREGIMTFSPYNEDQSWNSVARWLHTWIGNAWFVDVEDESNRPDSYTLSQNYPNPFNPSTIINYSIEKPGMVSIKVYDVLGREVADLVNEFKQTGRYNVSFNGTGLASGIYFYNITSGSFNSVRKMMLVK